MSARVKYKLIGPAKICLQSPLRRGKIVASRVYHPLSIHADPSDGYHAGHVAGTLAFAGR